MSNPSAPIKPVTQSELVRAALVVVAALVGLQLLWSARLLVLTAFLGVLIGLAASAAVDWILVRVKIKRAVVAVGVVFGTVGVFLLVMFWIGPTLATQSAELREKLPDAVIKLEDWMVRRQPELLDFIAPPDTSVATKDSTKVSVGGGRLFRALAEYAPQMSNLAFGVLQSTVAVFAAAILVIFLAVFIAVDPDVYKRGMLLLVPRERRARVDKLLTALSGALKIWFATQLIAMVVIGVVTTLILAVIGVRAAVPLGVLAGIFEFIPNLGPVLSAVPAILMGLADSPRMALIVVGVYWVIQFLENNLLIPYLMKEQLDLPPALTLVTQVVMAYVFGFIGLFVAIPLLATVIVTVRTLWIDDELPPLPTFEFRAIRRSKAIPIPGEIRDTEKT